MSFRKSHSQLERIQALEKIVGTRDFSGEYHWDDSVNWVFKRDKYGHGSNYFEVDDKTEEVLQDIASSCSIRIDYHIFRLYGCGEMLNLSYSFRRCGDGKWILRVGSLEPWRFVYFVLKENYDEKMRAKE